MNMRWVLGLGVAGASVSFLPAPARAVVLHPVEDATSVPGPDAAVVGRWGGNASAVAVAPNHILTTRHQGGGVGTTVVFAGTSYVVAEVADDASADLRVARIATPGGSPANLAAFTPVYSGSDAAPLTFTLGGFGRGRGTTLTTTNGTYGYEWNADGNTTLRFGRNTIDGNAVQSGTSVLFADFDGPGRPTALASEAMLTEFDSGGGWFVENGAGNWQVAALSRAVGHTGANADNPTTPLPPADPQPFNQALFASFQNAATSAPDYMDGVRLSSYRTFITANVPEPTGLALVGAAVSLLGMRRRR